MGHADGNQKARAALTTLLFAIALGILLTPNCWASPNNLSDQEVAALKAADDVDKRGFGDVDLVYASENYDVYLPAREKFPFQTREMLAILLVVHVGDPNEPLVKVNTESTWGTQYDEEYARELVAEAMDHPAIRSRFEQYKNLPIQQLRFFHYARGVLRTERFPRGQEKPIVSGMIQVNGRGVAHPPPMIDHHAGPLQLTVAEVLASDEKKAQDLAAARARDVPRKLPELSPAFARDLKAAEGVYSKALAENRKTDYQKSIDLIHGLVKKHSETQSKYVVKSTLLDTYKFNAMLGQSYFGLGKSTYPNVDTASVGDIEKLIKLLDSAKKHASNARSLVYAGVAKDIGYGIALDYSGDKKMDALIAEINQYAAKVKQRLLVLNPGAVQASNSRAGSRNRRDPSQEIWERNWQNAQQTADDIALDYLMNGH